jgi:hypothetical protein
MEMKSGKFWILIGRRKGGEEKGGEEKGAKKRG